MWPLPSACYERHMSRRNTDPSHSVCLVDERKIGRVLSAVPAIYWLPFNSEHDNRVACLFTYKTAPNVYTARCLLQMTVLLSEVIGCGLDGRGCVPERGGFSSYLTPSGWLRSCLLLTMAKQQEREAKDSGLFSTRVIECVELNSIPSYIVTWAEIRLYCVVR